LSPIKIIPLREYNFLTIQPVISAEKTAVAHSIPPFFNNQWMHIFTFFIISLHLFIFTLQSLSILKTGALLVLFKVNLTNDTEMLNI